jgi:multidrug efflux pump subunit AcrB
MPSQARDISTRAVAQRWRELTDPIPDAVELQFESSLFSVGSALDIQLQGDNVDELREAATRVRAKLGEYPGVIDIADSFRSGKQELKLRILPSGEALGLTLNDLARQVRQAFYGEEAQRIQRGRDDVRVMVRYTEAERRSLGSLEGMRIRTPDGSEVPFAAVARADLGRGFSSIKRVDRQRVVNVTADVDRTKTTSNQVLANLGTGGLEEILRDYPGVSYRLEGEQREQSEAVEALLPLFVIALFLIYALLGVPLRSYIQPLVIMSVIPFALVGAIVGHLLMGAIGIVRGLSFMSALGFIAASGVVVNASLVLMHYVNQRLASGASIREAARDASLARFRPIVLSSLTTFAGLTPLMFNRSVQAQFMVPMAISLAYGVLFATLITLLVVPSGLLILDDLRALRRRRPQVAVVADSKKVA